MTTRHTTRTQVKSFPAPAPLATVTDLAPQEAQAVTEVVNPLIADAFALYVKTNQ
jgi:starvation-inducible DNA-binding protein